MNILVGLSMVVFALVLLAVAGVMQLKKKKETGEEKPPAEKKKREKKEKPPKAPKEKGKAKKGKENGVSYAVPGQKPVKEETKKESPPTELMEDIPERARVEEPPKARGWREADTAQGREAGATALLDPPAFETDTGETQLLSAEPEGRFRFVGSDAGMPMEIRVDLSRGVFTIGRYDITMGTKSDFEFDKDTREVSRRHVEITRDGEGFIICDVGSKAGTFVNGDRLTAGDKYRLEPGARVSFGKAGADYIWEEV